MFLSTSCGKRMAFERRLEGSLQGRPSSSGGGIRAALSVGSTASGRHFVQKPTTSSLRPRNKRPVSFPELTFFSFFERYELAYLGAAVVSDVFGFRAVEHGFGRGPTKLLFDDVSRPAGDAGNGEHRREEIDR
jgi:hypothetical protein